MATPEQILKVRSYCFYPTEEELPDAIIAANIDKWTAIYPDPRQEPVVLYNATIDCLYYLIYTDPNGGGGTAGSTRREKVGQVEVEVGYTADYVSKWQKILDGYLNGDLWIPGTTRPIAKGVIIGGVERCEVDRVKNDPNSVNGLWGFGVDNRRPRGTFVDPYNPWRRR